MIFSTQKFGGSEAARNETLFTLGNGNLGFRGDTEEKAGTFHKGTYINGFYDKEPILYGENAYGYATNHETILNLPDSKRIELSVDGHRFNMFDEKANVDFFSLTLDEKKGTLTRRTDWNFNGESAISLESERLVSFVHEDCALIRYTVTNKSSKPEKISLASCIDTSAKNILAKDDPRIGAKFRHTPLIIDKTKAEAGELYFEAHTALSSLFLAGKVINILKVDEKDGAQKSPESSLLSSSSESSKIFPDIDSSSPSCFGDFVLESGKSFTLLKFISYVWGTSPENLKNQAEKSCEEFAKNGFEKAVREQEEFLEDFWKIADIDIVEEKSSDSVESNSSLQDALRFNLFHLLQSASRSGKASIAAKGLTSEGYEGHFFWDSECYVCPLFTYTAPKVAKKLLEYRTSILDKARERAKVMSLNGALFPWRTISGEETSAYFPAGTAQYHINADIVFALNRFLNAHEENSELKIDENAVQEICAESARMYASLGSFSYGKDGAFCINDVTGPDEYTAIVNNNAFTNFMARETFEIALSRAKNSADESEKSEWTKIAKKMYIPFDKDAGVYAQDDSFMNKPDWDFAHTPKENFPLLLHYHPLVIYRHRVLKQPDLVLAQFLLSRKFSLAEKVRNFNFYEKYTTGDSSLSHCIMSIMASATGDSEKALDYFNKTVRMDIDDVNGNSRDGIHTACMAGSWMSVVYGFAGFEDYGGKYSFNPHLPEGWKKLRFALSIRSAVVDVELTREKALYSLREGSEPLTLTHRNEEFTLRAGEEKSFSLKNKLSAVLFDLDGVVTDTAPLHFAAWKKMADEEGLKFDLEMNKKLLGISREASLEVILKENGVTWSNEKKASWCIKKNEIYKDSLLTLSEKDILPGIKKLLIDLKTHGVRAALASSSKNAPAILERLGLTDYFCAIADAAKVQKSKPEPDLFLEAAERSESWYTDCIGVEDAESGVKAIKKASMKAVGIETTVQLPEADLRLSSTASLTYEKLVALMEN
ncbi:beta-phosphoglucomutase [Treponema zioleckii]|uniref:beta-phosphoglucomutase n=1 Tax=Treponema zioleckii TaxID=331680 RepID=UPI00168B917A|nr:beta-phosphoglucomutase [Treponema zioleckii]